VTSHPAKRPSLELPDQPLRGGEGAETEMGSFEVIVAYNLDPPLRYAQEYFWLEVLAPDEREAVATAARWVLRAEEGFEATDWVRPAAEHEQSIGSDHRGEPLPVAWNLPLDSGVEPRTPIRDPRSGLRVGFVADPEAEKRWLPREAAGRYRLITRKPVAAADPVCLAPLVTSIGPSQLTGNYPLLG
jgi:hypothetical protein